MTPCPLCHAAPHAEDCAARTLAQTVSDITDAANAIDEAASVIATALVAVREAETARIRAMVESAHDIAWHLRAAAHARGREAGRIHCDGAVEALAALLAAIDAAKPARGGRGK